MTSLRPAADLNSWIKVCSEMQFGLNGFPSSLLASLIKGTVSFKVLISPKIPQGWGHGAYESLDNLRVES